MSMSYTGVHTKPSQNNEKRKARQKARKKEQQAKKREAREQERKAIDQIDLGEFIKAEKISLSNINRKIKRLNLQV